MLTDSSQRGASALLIAASLLLLMGFAALAVDTGLIYDERNQQQAAVDSGVLSAGLATAIGATQTGCSSSPTASLETSSACNGAAVAIGIINNNLGTGYTATDFADSVRCSDAAFPAEYATQGNGDGVVPRIGGTDATCIRFNSNLTKIRIILPTFAVDTSFGAVVGRDEIPVSAVAEANVELSLEGSIVPFAIGPTAAGESYGCIFTPGFGSNGNTPLEECQGPTDGNFGYLMSYLYGDDDFGTPEACGSGGGFNDSDRIAITLAKGADHLYGTTTLISGEARDDERCPNKNEIINYVDVRTGGFVSAVESGLFDADLSGTEGRLRCKDQDGALPEPDWLTVPLESQDSGAGDDCDTIGNALIPDSEGVDSTPLWEFLNAGVTELDPSNANACNGVTDRTGMRDCLESWKNWPGPSPHTEDLFSVDIQESPRFVWVPLLASDPSTGGSGYYGVIDFVPLYLHSTMFSCNAANSCDAIHEPMPTGGMAACTPGTFDLCGLPIAANKNLDALSSFILTKDMLPSPLDQFPLRGDRRIYNLSE